MQSGSKHAPGVVYHILNDNEEGREFSTISSLSSPSSIRLISRTTHHLNINRIGIPAFKITAWYHTLLDYSWAKFFAVLSIGFLITNLVFGGLYFIQPSGIDGVAEGRTVGDFFLCFCFSAQTITTIGYGKLAPTSYYIQVLVLIESFGSFLLSAFITGIVFSKISRPTRISKQILFSSVAVVNNDTPYYVDGQSCLDFGRYTTANTRKSQLCTSQVRLLLLHKSNDGSISLKELEYEIFPQIGRPRGINYSVPYLAFPWLITHTIDEKSPFFGIPPSSWSSPENYFELIVILDAVDETVSMNVQGRWSYVPTEIMLNAKFVDIVHVNEKTGLYDVDFTRFSDFVSTQQHSVIN